MGEVPNQIESYHARVQGTTINDTAYLATDYLNQFSEALMLAEVEIGLSDMLEDFIARALKAYNIHFEENGKADRQLAISATEFTLFEYQRELDTHILMLQVLIYDASPGNANCVHSVGVERRCLVVNYLIEHTGATISRQLTPEKTCSSGVNSMFGNLQETLGIAVRQGEKDARFG
jgi:hypothetical protein